MHEGVEIEGLRDQEPAKKRRGAPPGGWKARDRQQQEDIRPAMRSDSAREAAEYAAKILDERSNEIDQNDKFYVDPGSIPEGWTYQWKAMEITGKPNSYHMNAQSRMGWRAVPVSRHPDVFPPGTEHPVKDGLVLMELPTTLVQRFERQLNSEARGQIKSAEDQLYETPAGPGQAPRDEFPERMRVVKKELMGPVSVDNS